VSIDSLFKQNHGMVDRITRIVVGNVYVGLQTPIGWLGLILILTGAFGICTLSRCSASTPRALARSWG